MWYLPRLSKGVVRASFALRVEPGTHLYHEWRDAGTPYHVGPSLWVSPEGALTARDRKLMDLPHGAWIRFEIVCPIGDRAAGHYDLVVRLPGRTAPLRFTRLPHDPRFRSLDWFGFTANADARGVFYLDDIAIRSTKR